MSVAEIMVHMGEVKIAKHGEVLKSLLGSCVAVAFIWKKKQLCGLAHCLLPINHEPSFAMSGRFVNQAIPSLVALMNLESQDLAELEVIVVGGGNLTQPGAHTTQNLVGSQNLQEALHQLELLGIQPTYLERGGEEGRKITLCSLDGSYSIERVAAMQRD